MGWELTNVKQPFVEQLQGLGWTHIEGDPDGPAVTGRTSSAEVIQELVLRQRPRKLSIEQPMPTSSKQASNA